VVFHSVRDWWSLYVAHSSPVLSSLTDLCLVEVIGYSARAVNANQSPDWSVGPYAIQSLMLLLAPTLFAASIYMILARIVKLTDGEEHSVIRVKWLTPTFVTGDVLSFLVQSGGGGLMVKAKTQSKLDTAQNMITGGLGIQVVFFVFFMVVTILFHIRMRKAPSLRSQSLSVPWEQYIYVLYAASVLILIRSVFRIAEYVGGSDGVLLSKEMYLYIFDAALMFLVMILFNLRHPSLIIAGKKDMEREAESAGSNYPMQDRVERTSVRVEHKR
jgi:hypothetical protein